jgi:hypothetical protein
MIKFFRNIRQNLLSEGQTGKYLKYAIGEIVLVVIGILIALGINSMNQERIKQKKIDSILVKIQNDLLQDLTAGDRLVNNFIHRNSMASLVSSGNLTVEDVIDAKKSMNLSLIYVVYFWNGYVIRPNGYNQLMNILDDIPEEYDELIDRLSANYNWQRTFGTMNENSEDIANQYRDYLAKNHSWRALDNHSGEISDEQMDYILNNPRFKNHVNLLHEVTISLVWGYTYYRKQLMESYIMINEQLGESAKAIPKEIRTTSLAHETDAEKIVGTYKVSAGLDNTGFGKKLEIFREGKDLYIKKEYGEKRGPLLFMDSEKPWFSVVGDANIFRFENNGENKLSIINPGRDQTHWLKVINEEINEK